MKAILQKALRRLGYEIIQYRPIGVPEISASQPPIDLTEEEARIISRVRSFTMTSLESLIALLRAVKYIVKHQIPGDIAECGVWRGGSMMAVAMTLLSEGDTSRHLYLYDTFEGMSWPTELDKRYDGALASEQLKRTPRNTGIWCYTDISEVQANILSTGYPEDKIHLIKGKVEDTLPTALPRALSLLRLDTDWYESTKCELDHLFPILSHKGILIIDDYGHWQGSKKATDEYFEAQKTCIYLSRVDYTVRIAVKIEE